MLKNLKRISAALFISALILPHFALAGWVNPTSIDSCKVDGGGACSASGWNEVIDNDDSTYAGFPNSDLSVTYDLALSSEMTISGVQVDHGASVSSDEYCDNYTVWFAGSDKNYDILYATWFGEGLGTKIKPFSEPAQTGQYVRVICASVNVNTENWGVSDFRINAAAGGGVPEMGVWALLVILPVMFFVVYKSVPEIKPTAI